MNSKKIIENITDWLKNYCLKSQTNGFVVGVSGGVLTLQLHLHFVQKQDYLFYV